MRAAWLMLALPLSVALVGCDRNGAGSIAGNTAWDLLWGEPDAEALAPSARFDESGIAFDYPALLRRRESVEENGDRSWSLEHGLFELEVSARPSGLSGADVLAAIGMLFSGGRRIDAEGPSVGRSELLCGQRLTATKLRVKMMGDWSELQAFDLPAPAGESRVLVFDDEPGGDHPSAVARATWARVLGSLRCDPAFVLPASTAGEDEEEREHNGAESKPEPDSDAGTQ